MSRAYVVEDTPLGAELKSLEDGEVKPVEGGNTTGLWVENVGTFRVSKVLLDPHGAESFLEAIILRPSSRMAVSLLLLALLTFFFLHSGWCYDLESVPDSDDGASISSYTLDFPNDVVVNVESLSEEVSVEGTEKVVA